MQDKDNRWIGTVAILVAVTIGLGLVARSIIGADRFAHPDDATSWLVDGSALGLGLLVLALVINRRHPDV